MLSGNFYWLIYSVWDFLGLLFGGFVRSLGDFFGF